MNTHTIGELPNGKPIQVNIYNRNLVLTMPKELGKKKSHKEL